MVGEIFGIIRETNFDQYLQKQLMDPEFAERFNKAGEAWDIAMQLTALRKAYGKGSNLRLTFVKYGKGSNLRLTFVK